MSNTTDLIAEARELCSKATPGPWEATFGMDCRAFIKTPVEDSDFKLYNHADAAFIARSRTLVEDLAAALEKAESDNDLVKRMYAKVCEDKCALEQANRWIPVEEGLPEAERWYLIYTGRSIMTAYLDKHGDWNDSGMQPIVTHWRPLPEGPKGE